jgi:hypothetical protein
MFYYQAKVEDMVEDCTMKNEERTFKHTQQHTEEA